MKDDFYKKIAEQEPAMFKPDEEEPSDEPFSFTILTFILLALIGVILLVTNLLAKW